MKIRKEIYEQIIRRQNTEPPETGGIIGGRDGIVDAEFFDEGSRTQRLCSYTPNVKVLNRVIEDWQRRGISFMGIYHTHFCDVETLSVGDRYYIEKILKNMPAEIARLYFPLVVMPKRKMICYYAEFLSGQAVVRRDNLIIL